MSTSETPQPPIAVLGETPLGSGFMGAPRPLQYRLEITTGDGDHLTLTDINSLAVNRRHTAMSDWSATVPTRPNIDDRVLSAIRLSWGDTVLFRGRLEDVSGDLLSPTVEISGRGIEADLTRGEVTLDLRNVRRIDAIRQVWRQQTDFSAAVIEPDDPDHPAMTRITTDSDGGDYSGTPMKVLKTLHEEANMRFTVLHSRPGLNAESYPIGSRRRRHDWDVLDGDRDVSAKDYANVVTVTGALKPGGSGERYRGVAADEAEIAAMAQRGIGDDGRVVYPIRDPSIKNDQDMSEKGARTGAQKCQDKAESKLPDLTDNNTVGGSLEITPTVAAPGYSYFIEEFSGGVPRAFGEGVFGADTFGSSPGQYVSLNKVNYSISRGDESCSLDFAQRDGFAGTLEAAYGGQ